MFALFEGISNKLLVLASLLLGFSFMKMMIHCSALRRAGSGCSEGSPPLLLVWGKALQWIRLIQENQGKIFAWQVNTPLSVLVRTELGWTWHFFPFCQKCMYNIAYFHKSVPQMGIFFFQAAKWVSRQLEQTPVVGWESSPNFPKCIWVLWKSEIVQPAPRCEGWRQPPPVSFKWLGTVLSKVIVPTKGRSWAQSSVPETNNKKNTPEQIKWDVCTGSHKGSHQH